MIHWLVLAIGLLFVFLIVLTIPPFARFFSLISLPPTAYLLIGFVTLLWGLLLLLLWRFRVLERFLQLDE